MNDRSYTKLFSSIVTSSLWSEDSNTRVVWVTMLALANSHGEVSATAPGLARVANVPLDACREALTKFEAPDPDSRSRDNEGRRIERIEGGWRLLNYQHYRDMMSCEDRAEYQRKYMAKYRASGRDRSRPVVNTTVNSGKEMLGGLGQAEAEAEAKSTHTSVPVPLGSSSKSACVELNRIIPDKRLPANGDGMLDLVQRLNGLYHRPNDSPWTYEEQHKCAEIARRPSWTMEWDALIEYRKKLREKRYFPQSVHSLLNGWTEQVDKARTAQRNPSLVGGT